MNLFYDPSDPRNHRVVVRVPKPLNVEQGDALWDLEDRYRGLDVSFDGVGATEIFLSGLVCLPFCPPSWEPKVVDLHQECPQEATGSRRTGETGSSARETPEILFRQPTALSGGFVDPSVIEIGGADGA